MALPTITLSLKKIISICPLNLFLFSVYRMKIGSRWGRFLVIFADHLDYKFWWV